LEDFYIKIFGPSFFSAVSAKKDAVGLKSARTAVERIAAMTAVEPSSATTIKMRRVSQIYPHLHLPIGRKTPLVFLGLNPRIDLECAGKGSHTKTELPGTASYILK
jgi:hypothetical protein